MSDSGYDLIEELRANGLVREPVHEDWLYKESWTLQEGAFLIFDVEPTARVLHYLTLTSAFGILEKSVRSLYTDMDQSAEAGSLHTSLDSEGRRQATPETILLFAHDRGYSIPESLQGDLSSALESRESGSQFAGVQIRYGDTVYESPGAGRRKTKGIVKGIQKTLEWLNLNEALSSIREKGLWMRVNDKTVKQRIRRAFHDSNTSYAYRMSGRLMELRGDSWSL